MRAKANENRALRSKPITDELKTINTIEHGSSLEIKNLMKKIQMLYLKRNIILDLKN